jgi:hypothetical protein
MEERQMEQAAGRTAAGKAAARHELEALRFDVIAADYALRPVPRSVTSGEGS